MIYLNGRLVTDTEAAIDPTDRGLTLGDGLYETIAVRHGIPLKAAAHIERLRAGAETIGLVHSFADAQLLGALGDTIAANGLKQGVLRLTLTRGAGLRGLPPSPFAKPTLLIVASPWPPRMSDPVSAVVATVTRRNEFSPLSACKSLNALDNVLARLEAIERGADDAVLLNTRGFVAEATSSNLFAVIGGRLATPPVSEGALPGIMRRFVMDSITTGERPMTPDDLFAASEIFLTNSLGVRALVSLDGRRIGTGTPGAASIKARKIAAIDD